MIWLKVGSSRNNSLVIGGIYRQHQLLGQAELNMTKAELLYRQEQRWNYIVKRWKEITRNKNSIILGDLNLDHLKWGQPDPINENMVNEVKDKLETSGFQQHVTNATRFWRQQEDSCLDQIWSNCPERIIKITNETRGSSDHNIVGVELALREIKTTASNTVRRTWTNF